MAAPPSSAREESATTTPACYLVASRPRRRRLGLGLGRPRNKALDYSEALFLIQFHLDAPLSRRRRTMGSRADAGKPLGHYHWRAA